MITIEEIKAAFPKFEWVQGWSDDRIKTWYGTFNEDEDDEQNAKVEYRSHGIIIVELAETSGSGPTLAQAKEDINKRMRDRIEELEVALDFV